MSRFEMYSMILGFFALTIYTGYQGHIEVSFLLALITMIVCVVGMIKTH